MFCFGLQSIARFELNIKTNAPLFNTHRLEAEVKFSETFNLSRKKIKKLFTCPGRSILGENVPSVLRPKAVLKTSGTVSPNADLPASE